jgi:hypothetical protein
MTKQKARSVSDGTKNWFLKNGIEFLEVPIEIGVFYSHSTDLSDNNKESGLKIAKSTFGE